MLYKAEKSLTVEGITAKQLTHHGGGHGSQQDS